jgi:hypothetical protein
MWTGRGHAGGLRWGSRGLQAGGKPALRDSCHSALVKRLPLDRPAQRFHRLNASKLGNPRSVRLPMHGHTVAGIMLGRLCAPAAQLRYAARTPEERYIIFFCISVLGATSAKNR